MLALKLRPGERFVINGAVIHNGTHRHTLYLANRAQVLRERDVMQIEQATTPVSQLHYLIQLMLLDPAGASDYRPAYERRRAELMDALRSPDMQAALAEVGRHVDAGDHYKALAALRVVKGYEASLLGGRDAVPA